MRDTDIYHLILPSQEPFTYLCLSSSSAALSGVGSGEQQSQQRHPDLPGTSHILQLIQRDLKVFPVHPRDVVPPSVSWVLLEASRWDMPGPALQGGVQ